MSRRESAKRSAGHACADRKRLHLSAWHPTGVRLIVASRWESAQRIALPCGIRLPRSDRPAIWHPSSPCAPRSVRALLALVVRKKMQVSCVDSGLRSYCKVRCCFVPFASTTNLSRNAGNAGELWTRLRCVDAWDQIRSCSRRVLLSVCDGLEGPKGVHHNIIHRSQEFNLFRFHLFYSATVACTSQMSSHHDGGNRFIE
jgi:hypothetical protein